MGEAKRRAAIDPNFGGPKPLGRGLVVSSPVEIDGTSVSFPSAQLDPQELRSSLLLWDKLVWPTSNVIHNSGGGPDVEYLEAAGILTRPKYNFVGKWDGAQALIRTHIQAFKDLEDKEPGQWALAQGENSLLIKDRVLMPNAGVLLELTRAIPVPDKEVPLNEILEFKQKRFDELGRLRMELDTFVSAVSQADDKEAELQKHVMTVDAACTDVLRVSHEWQFPVRLTDFKVSSDIRPFNIAGSGIAAYVAATPILGLPASEAVLTSIAGAAVAARSALKITNGFGWRGLKKRMGPFKYVNSYHQELF